MFGCCADVVLILWYKLLRADLIPEKGTMAHLLWILMYVQNYPKWKTMSKLTNGTDPKTLRLWIGLFQDSIEQIEGDVVSLIYTYICERNLFTRILLTHQHFFCLF
jgi:hypothetical protein